MDIPSPALIAWRCMREDPDRFSPSLTAPCARCGEPGALEALARVVSDNFTAWQTLDPSSSGLCQPCAWAFRGERNRSEMIMSTRAGRAQVVEPKAAVDALSSPLAQECALSVPISGRKHVLPSMEWGAVSSDYGVLAWGDEAAGLMRSVAALRALGASDDEFSEPAPPARLARRHLADSASILVLFTCWQAVTRWAGTPHLRVAVRASRQARRPAGGHE